MDTYIIKWAIAIAGGAVICLGLVFMQRWRRHTTDDVAGWFADENMPVVLRKAELFMSEQEISTDSPIPLHGRVDQVFLTKHGLLIPVDTKTRDTHRVYESDIWQLGVYAVILQARYRYPVCSYGFVRTVLRTETTRDVRYHAVRLPSLQNVIRMSRKDCVQA